MHEEGITAGQLASLLEEFLADVPKAALLEDGEHLFDFATARYSVSGEGKCVLHIWSEERNIVRRVVGAGVRGKTLRLSVLRFGQTQCQIMEIAPQGDRCMGLARRSRRQQYQQLLKRVLLREFPGFAIEHLSSSPDLEHSFSPIYARAMLRRGQSAFAVLGVNEAEMQPSMDAALSFGILWMDYQRQRLAGRAHVAGLKLFLPPGGSETVRQRAAFLNCGSATWQLYELDERSENCEPLDCRDSGNIFTRLTRPVDRAAAEQRFAASIARIRALAPAADIAVESSMAIAFRLYGLEFARACITPLLGSFRNSESILFGVGRAEYVLDEATEEIFIELVRRITEQRKATRSQTNLFFRLAPERWLEALIVRDIRTLDACLDARCVYSQVPAFAAGDRDMIDVLTCTLDGRLVVVELKADEDLHLPLQGLDYWARVRWLQQHDEFRRNGYFAGREISSLGPLLFLVTPALRLHPTTDTLLRYLSPQIEWTVLQLDERWRHGVRVINRKHPEKHLTADFADFAD